MKLNLIEFPSSLFNYVSGSKTLVSEASDLGNRHLQPLYDDACDCGFAVKSAPTGEVVTYVMDGMKKDEEGDIQYWTYSPTSESERKVPLCIGTTAKIFND